MLLDEIKQHTLNWLRSFIIEYAICPFAKGVVNKGSLRISISEAKKNARALEDLMKEVHFLDENPAIETTLLVFANAYQDFFAYLDFVALAEQLLEQLNYEGVYQIATFHPNYFFADTEPDDVTNYTNRAPYPIIHLLREDHLDKVIAAYGDTDKIPERNMALMRELGLSKLKKIFTE